MTLENREDIRMHKSPLKAETNLLVLLYLFIL